MHGLTYGELAVEHDRAKDEIARLRAALEETNGILVDATYEPEKRIIYAVLTINKALANEQEKATGRLT